MKDIQNIRQLQAALRTIARELLEARNQEFTVKVGLEEIDLNPGIDCESGWKNNNVIDIYDHIVRDIFAVYEIDSFFDLLDAIDPDPVIEIVDRHNW